MRVSVVVKTFSMTLVGWALGTAPGCGVGGTALSVLPSADSDVNAVVGVGICGRAPGCGAEGEDGSCASEVVVVAGGAVVLVGGGAV